MEVNPLNIFFVKSDSKGDRLLFRYPYTLDSKDENKQKKRGRNNPYAISSTEDLLQNPQAQTSNISQGQLSGFTDEMLSTLFAVKAELCNKKFELKVNDVRFVGHPTLLPYRTNKDDTGAMILINIVFALQASASHSIVKCYYDLSKRLGKALRHEEKRCSYLTEEMKLMLAAHDEVSALDSEINGENDDDEDILRLSICSNSCSLDNGLETGPKCAFHLILQRSSLARSMKAVFEDLSSTGIVQVRINKWVLLSFCLPHKAHQIHNRGLIIEPETIDKCLQKLRPYHGILLMVNPNELLASIPLDGSAALLRLIKLYSPLKSLQTLAIEADLSLMQVFQLTGHLVYWAKATVIYPLCEGNVYVVSPGGNIHIHSPLVEEFAKEFPGVCLLQTLGEFSLPAPLWYQARGGGGVGGGGSCGGSARLARVVAWLLQRRLLLQLHTYVQFNSPHWGRSPDGKEYYCEKHNSYYQPTNDSYSSLNHIQLNVPEPIETRTNGHVFPDSDEDYPTKNNLNHTDFSHTKPIVIDAEFTKYDEYNEVDSANHSYDDGIDVVDGIITTNGTNNDFDAKKDSTQKKAQGNSVDSGISNNINGNNNKTEKQIGNGTNNLENINGIADLNNEKVINKLQARLSDSSLKENVNTSNKEINTSSDDDRFESDQDMSPRLKKTNGVVKDHDRKNDISLNLKLQSEMSFQPPTVWSIPSSCDIVTGGVADTSPPTSIAPPATAHPAPHSLHPMPPAESALDTFTAEERAILAAIPAANNPADLLLLAQLHKKGYFRGEQHLEEIMFMENVTRSQLMQLLDKFKDVLITFETEDPAVAMLYP